MRIAVLVVVGLALGGCAGDTKAYGEKVSADFETIHRPAMDAWTACAKSFVHNFQNKTTDPVSLDAALTAYCGTQENAIRMAGLLYEQKYPGVYPGYMTVKTNAFIVGLHKDTVGIIIARQLQAQ